VAPHFPNLEFLNFGGGIGIPYKPDDTAIDVEEFGEKANELFSNFCKSYGRNLTLMMEPGRYVCGEAGILVAEVNTLKKTPQGRVFAGLNTGYHHLVRPLTYGSYHPIINVSNSSGEQKKYDIAGNICESGDLFARDRMINEIREGDLLAITHAGASGFCMANHYHLRPLPPEIVIDGDKKIVSREREKFEDIIAPYNL
ncbi:MAG: diaminopimelate decarboxylase, partial [Candidatus Curtissbacteria bacterium]|nr:diaminopimelate decarboxylase [Candidatus Curtissbacteria bacterium]